MIEIPNQVLLHPVPIVVIGTYDGHHANFTTIGDIAVAGLNPPLVMFSLNVAHKSQELLKKYKRCSINVLDKKHIKEIDYAGMFSGNTLSKDDLFKYQLIEQVPVISDAMISLVVYTNTTHQISQRVITVADVIRTFIDDKYYENQTINLIKSTPVLYGLDNFYYSDPVKIGEGYKHGIFSKVTNITK